MPFDGFPRNVRATPVPDPLFNSLLEEIEDPAELKVTFRLIWLLGQKRGAPRYVTGGDLLNDPTLLRGLKSLGGDPRDRIRQGLSLALTRGTILRRQDSEGNSESIYLLNSEENRRRLAGIKAPAEAVPTSGSYRKLLMYPPLGRTACRAFTTFTRTTLAPLARSWVSNWPRPRTGTLPSGSKKPSK